MSDLGPEGNQWDFQVPVSWNRKGYTDSGEWRLCRQRQFWRWRRAQLEKQSRSQAPQVVKILLRSLTLSGTPACPELCFWHTWPWLGTGGSRQSATGIHVNLHASFSSLTFLPQKSVRPCVYLVNMYPYVSLSPQIFLSCFDLHSYTFPLNSTHW